MRRFSATIVVALAACAAPLLWTTLTGPSAQAVPPGKPSYEANSYVETHYPRELIEAVTVTVDGGADTVRHRARLDLEADGTGQQRRGAGR